MTADKMDREIWAVGGSMSPFILSGSRLFVERAFADRLRVGDVVCFIGDAGQGVAHRVLRIAVSADGLVLRMKGDAQNGWEDVPEGAVLYKVNRVSHRFLSYDLDSPLGRLFARVALAEDFKYALTWISIRKIWSLYRFFKRNRPIPS